MFHIHIRLKDAWSFASAMDAPDAWTELAKAALKHLDVDIGVHLQVLHVLLFDTCMYM